MKKLTLKSAHPPRRHLAACVLGIMLGFFSAISSVSAVDVAQQPLYAGSRVPGNVVLVPSVEYPTIHSQANIGNYAHDRRYAGYFDSGKCYRYQHSANEEDRHFYPTRAATSFNCSEQDEWSGNYLNWAVTQTIDPFRSALTGGYRVRDEPDETWLEKARHAPTYGLYPNRRLPGSNNNHTLVQSITGAAWGSITVRIAGLGNKMWFTSDGGMGDGATVVAYDPDVHRLNDVQEDWSRVYEVSVRVKVCDPSVPPLESNCQPYSQGWKPEGLIQEYSDRIRYSIFGFLNETGNQRDGGVMRARQKFVGPQTHYPELGPTANLRREWDQETGVFVRNPDSGDAAATGMGVQDSGVINYLNKFGQMTSQNPKGNDPVSELYYAALRYFRGQGNVSSYSDNLTYERADGFPVITDWDDPIRYACQVNAALGIGDVYTHEDRNIPNAPDNDLQLARDYTQKIFDLEGIDKSSSDVFTGRGNSAYIAGLAYFANTNDLRSDSPGQPNSVGRQTLSTYWVDVRENQRLEPRQDNQYWLAAKYGGFSVPSGFDPMATTGLEQSWWHNSGEYLVSGANGDVTTTVTTYPRPDNFYVASEADKMVASLRQAFQNIVDEVVGSGGGFASNTTTLEAGAMTFQARFRVDGGSWSGDLQAYEVDPGTAELTPAWVASSALPDWDDRQIWVNSGGYKRLNSFAGLSGTHQGLIGSEEVMNYLRGERSNEQPGGTLRARNGVLGSIVNSQPVYVGAPNPRLFLGAGFTGANEYQAFASANQTRVPMVYVGANDGMLHGFNATTGEELFAFMPAAAIEAGIGDYAQPGFEHRYFVDGDMTVADAYHPTNGWRTVLVGTMGRGGRAAFALDVTDPENIEFLWERSATSGPALPAFGNNLGKPIVAQVADGDWQVFLGNGPNGSGGNAQLIILDVFTGAGSAISAGTGGDNGLSGVNVWASATGGFSDTVYAGDLQGNMWKFVRDSGTGVWGNSLLFRALHSGTPQPITATPLVSRRPGTTETWVFFGTGRYLAEADLSDKGVQTWYGLIDRGSTIPSDRETLDPISIIAETEINGVAVRGIEESPSAGADGWYMNLLPPSGVPMGERMVVPNQFRGLTLIGTTRIPDVEDMCSPSGTGFVMAIDPFTGGRLSGGFFDIDGDGQFDEVITLEDGTEIPVSGVGMPSGPNDPIFIGEQMLVNLDDASDESVKTNVAGTEPSRVSWRELLRN